MSEVRTITGKAIKYKEIILAASSDTRYETKKAFCYNKHKNSKSMIQEQPTVPVLLSDDQVKSQLVNLEGWEYDPKKLKIAREFRFKGFQEAAAFMMRIFLIAERMDHHPEILNVYQTVEIKLQTHRVGGVSYLDLRQATKINEIM